MQEKVLRAKLNEYEAVLTMRRYSADYDSGLWYGGAESRPRWVVRNLSLTYRGRQVPLKRGVYSDLAEVNQIRFVRRQGEMVLVIDGGDAGDSYVAYLFFRGGRLKRRRVEHGEFPKNFYEETRYVSIPVRD